MLVENYHNHTPQRGDLIGTSFTFSGILNTSMKLLIIQIFLILLITGCTKPSVDIFDKLWDKIDNMKEEDKVSESDQKLIIKATEKEWEDVDKEGVIIPPKKPTK